MDVFDCIIMSLQFLRICNLIALLCLYLVPCSRDTSDIDAEYQSLLADQNTTDYGATAATHNAASTERDGEENEQLNEEIRFANGGSWWGYAKEFKVLDVLEISLTQLLTICRFSSHTSGQMKGFSNFKLSFLDFIHLHQMP